MSSRGTRVTVARAVKKTVASAVGQEAEEAKEAKEAEEAKETKEAKEAKEAKEVKETKEAEEAEEADKGGVGNTSCFTPSQTEYSSSIFLSNFQGGGGAFEMFDLF